MDERFLPTELLFRSAKPDLEMYWKPDGTPTSAVFKDSWGTSVDRDGGRTPDEAADFLSARKPGTILYVTVSACYEYGTFVRYCPTDDNPWHSQIQRSEDEPELTTSQAKRLARSAIVFRR